MNDHADLPVATVAEIHIAFDAAQDKCLDPSWLVEGESFISRCPQCDGPLIVFLRGAPVLAWEEE